MTDYQIAHVVGKMPTPLAIERTRQRRSGPVISDPREAFAAALSAGGTCTREQALAEYDRAFGGR